MSASRKAWKTPSGWCWTFNEMPRLDSKLESEGAEFLVLGNLLVEGIVAYKAYVRTAGYDLIAADPDRGSSVRIQVKSRWATDNNGFLIKRYDCDFVVFVSLNRGFRYKRGRNPDEGRMAPHFYVLPVELVRAALRPTSKLGQTKVWSIPELETYRENWELIRSHLRAPPSLTSS